MTAGVEEVLVELLGDIERLCRQGQLSKRAFPLRAGVLEAAVKARTRMEKVKLGVVAA